MPVLVLGNGSNLLVADAGFPGPVVTLGAAFGGIEIAGTTVRAGGAVTLPVLARRTAAAALTGLEWAVGVPGSVGGAVRMNAGGHGSDVSRTITRAGVVDLRASTGVPGVVDRNGLDLSYRHSSIAPHHVVAWAEFRLTAGDREAAETEIAQIVRWRRENQPGGQNAGSVFTNPPGDAAGRIIDSCGLKGLRVGGVVVSEKHANFFAASPGARADDVLALMRLVQSRVEAETGVRLVPELQLVGFADASEEVGG